MPSWGYDMPESRVEQVKSFCLNMRRYKGTSAIMNDGNELNDMSIQIGGNFYKADVVESVVVSLATAAQLGDLSDRDLLLLELLRDSNVLPRP